MCAESRKASSGSEVVNEKRQHNPKQETRTMHRHETETETMMPGEGTKESDIYRAGGGGDGVQVSVILR
jgi:hypothetical protein